MNRLRTGRRDDRGVVLVLDIIAKGELSNDALALAQLPGQ
jgi:hypothetical protein